MPMSRYQSLRLLNGEIIRLKYCYTCRFFIPPRAHHCGVCNVCISRLDHHCPWLGLCIGERNYRPFFMFIHSLSWLAIYNSACMITHLILCMLLIYFYILIYAIFLFIIIIKVKRSYSQNHNNYYHRPHQEDICGNEFNHKLMNFTSHKSTSKLININYLMIGELLYTLALLWILFGFIGYHCSLVVQNMTTYEDVREMFIEKKIKSTTTDKKFTKQKQTKNKNNYFCNYSCCYYCYYFYYYYCNNSNSNNIDVEIKNPYSLGSSYHNMCHLLCGPLPSTRLV